MTLSLFGAFTSAHFNEHAEAAGHSGQPRAAGAEYHVGAGVIAETPRLATFYVQARFVGSQFEDDLNLITLDNYAVVDASASRPITRHPPVSRRREHVRRGIRRRPDAGQIDWLAVHDSRGVRYSVS